MLKKDTLVLFVQRGAVKLVGMVVRREPEELVGDGDGWKRPRVGIAFPFSDAGAWQVCLSGVCVDMVPPSRPVHR